MATKYECDRCGSQHINQSNVGRISYPTCDYYQHISEYLATKDLCENCIRALTKFLEKQPTAVAK